MPRNKEKRDEYMKAYRSTDEYRAKARERAAERKKTPEYMEWFNSPEGKEYRRSMKEKYRRQAGARTRQEISEQGEKRRAELAHTRQLKNENRQAFKDQFIGPPTAKSVMSDAEYYRHRYAADEEFMAKELDRAQQWKIKTRPGYAGSSVKWQQMPQAVKQVKQLIHNISKPIKEQCHA